MKKLLNLLKNDERLMGNITSSSFYALILINFVVIFVSIESVIDNGEMGEVINWLVPVLTIDGIFIILILLMYVISEKLFRPRNAVIVSFLIVICASIYYRYTGVQGTISDFVYFIIRYGILLSYIILGLGILLRGLWEWMQDRVGGDYREIKLTYKTILSNMNIFMFSVSLVIYLITSVLYESSNINHMIIFTCIAIGCTIFIIGFVIRKVISVISSVIK